MFNHTKIIIKNIKSKLEKRNTRKYLNRYKNKLKRHKK